MNITKFIVVSPLPSYVVDKVSNIIIYGNTMQFSLEFYLLVDVEIESIVNKLLLNERENSIIEINLLDARGNITYSWNVKNVIYECATISDLNWDNDSPIKVKLKCRGTI